MILLVVAEYLWGSIIWSAAWFALGWLTCYFTMYVTGGRK